MAAGYPQGTGELSRAREIGLPPADRLGRANEHALGLPLLLPGYDVEQVVHPVDEIDVGPAWRAEKNLGSPGAAVKGVGGTVEGTEVGLGLDDAGASLAPAHPMDEDFSDKVAGETLRGAIEEGDLTLADPGRRTARHAVIYTRSWGGRQRHLRLAGAIRVGHSWIVRSRKVLTMASNEAKISNISGRLTKTWGPVMNSYYLRSVDTLRKRLEDLGSQSAALYLSIGRTMPVLLHELEEGFAEPERIIASFSASNSGGASGGIVREARDVVVEAAEFFGEMGRRDEAMLAAIAQSIERLSQLDKRIGAIREIAFEMELVSLNSMVTAIKAGLPGRALSYITDELRRLSSRTVDAAERITSRGKTILERLSALRTMLSEVHDFQRFFYSGFGEKLSSSFGRFQEAAYAIADSLSQIAERAQGVRSPLSRIMEEVQQQDIIKQGVDQVVISLSQLGEAANLTDEEAKLDTLSFREHIAGLCVSMLDDIDARIGRGVYLFTSELQAIKEQLDRVEQERLSFLKSTVPASSGADKEEVNAPWSLSFDESARVLGEISANIERAKDAKKGIVGETQAVVQELGLLEESLQRFARVTSQFYPIKVLSQLEVTKQRLLDKGITTIEQMSALSERINVEMADALAMVRDVMKQSNEQVRSYALIAHKEVIAVETMAARIEHATGRFLNLRERIAASLASFSLYSTAFLDNLKASERAVEGVGELTADVGAIRAEVDSLWQEAKHMRGKGLSDLRIGTWTVKDERLRGLIERFTLFAHKRTAAAIGGFEVEQGGAEGELTIF